MWTTISKAVLVSSAVLFLSAQAHSADVFKPGKYYISCFPEFYKKTADDAYQEADVYNPVFFTKETIELTMKNQFNAIFFLRGEESPDKLQILVPSGQSCLISPIK